MVFGTAIVFVLPIVLTVLLTVVITEVVNLILYSRGDRIFDPGSFEDRKRIFKRVREDPGLSFLLAALFVFFGILAVYYDEALSSSIFLGIAIVLIVYSWSSNRERLRGESQSASDLEVAAKRMVALSDLFFAMSRRAIELVNSPASGADVGQVCKKSVDAFMLYLSKNFEGEGIEIGVSIYRPDPEDPTRLKHWDNLHVGPRHADNPNGLDDLTFFIGPVGSTRSAAGRRLLASRGLAGISFVEKRIELTVISQETKDDGTVFFTSTNPGFVFEGGERQNPGFASLVTIPVFGFGADPCAVLSIDSNRKDQFESAKTIDLLPDLAGLLGLTLALAERRESDAES